MSWYPFPHHPFPEPPLTGFKKSLETRKYLRLHWQGIHQGKWKVGCSECGRTLHDQSHLRDHMVVHFNDSKITCNVWKASILSRERLQTHNGGNTEGYRNIATNDYYKGDMLFGLSHWVRLTSDKVQCTVELVRLPEKRCKERQGRAPEVEISWNTGMNEWSHNSQRRREPVSTACSIYKVTLPTTVYAE